MYQIPPFGDCLAPWSFHLSSPRRGEWDCGNQVGTLLHLFSVYRMYQVNIFIPCVFATRPLFGEGGSAVTPRSPNVDPAHASGPNPVAPRGWLGCPGTRCAFQILGLLAPLARICSPVTGPNALCTQVQLVGAAQLLRYQASGTHFGASYEEEALLASLCLPYQ